jgi:superfamily II DNA or RNA helicase
VYLYNQSIGIDTDDQYLKEHLKDFIKKHYTQATSTFGNSDFAKPPSERVYANIVKGWSSYILHRNQFLHLLRYLDQHGYDLSKAEKINKKDYDVEAIDVPVKEGWVPYPKQELAIQFLLDPPMYAKLLPTQTGSGKASMSLVTLSRMGVRAAICILPTYIEKTIADITKTLQIDTKDIMVIQGGKSMDGLVQMAKEGQLTSPFIIFSSTTLSLFNKSYEDDKEYFIEKYEMSPIDLVPLLKVGVLLIDETHQHFHSMYKVILNSNVKRLIGMSATFITDDPFVRKIHQLVYPEAGIYKDFGHVKYIDVYSIGYSINPDFQRHVRYSERGSTFYSHTAYEQSIHKIPYLRKRYYNLIRITLDDYFLEHYQKGDRFVVFVSTVVMATEVTAYLKEAYPLLDIRRYCEDDPFENLTDPDGRVTTIASAGTNKDIKQLRVAVNTISISSTPTNLQVLGRLRQLPDRDVKYCQLFNEGLAKHIDYNNKRTELFRDKVKTISQRRSRVNV